MDSEDADLSVQDIVKAYDTIKEKGSGHLPSELNMWEAMARAIFDLQKRIAHLESVTGARPSPHIPEHRSRK